jgi:hypothetical protein
VGSRSGVVSARANPDRKDRIDPPAIILTSLSSLNLFTPRAHRGHISVHEHLGERWFSAHHTGDQIAIRTTNGMKRAHYDISAGPASPHDHVSLLDGSDGAARRRVPKVSKKIQACML